MDINIYNPGGIVDLIEITPSGVNINSLLLHVKVWNTFIVYCITAIDGHIKRVQLSIVK